MTSDETLNFKESKGTRVQGRTPKVVEMRIIPVAGKDSMLLNLSGAHGPYFTRNIVILKDEEGTLHLEPVMLKLENGQYITLKVKLIELILSKR